MKCCNACACWVYPVILSRRGAGPVVCIPGRPRRKGVLKWQTGEELMARRLRSCDDWAAVRAWGTLMEIGRLLTLCLHWTAVSKPQGTHLPSLHPANQAVNQAVVSRLFRPNGKQGPPTLASLVPTGPCTAATLNVRSARSTY